MRALVTAASKHGGTAEIADVIAARLRSHGIDVWRAEPHEVQSLDGIEGAVIGSGVYAGHWLSAAKDLVETFPTAWRERRIWMFSSGPLGDPPEPDEDPVDVAELMEATGATDHVLFNGQLVRSKLGFGERALVRALRAPTGDFRDWPAIEEWANHIAQQLTTPDEHARPRT